MDGPLFARPNAAAICFRFYALLDRLNVLEWSCTCAHSKCIRPPWPCLVTHSGSKGLISAENKQKQFHEFFQAGFSRFL